MAICLPTYLAAMSLNLLNPSPVNDRWTSHPVPLSKRASADFTSFPVMSSGPSESRFPPLSVPFRIGSTTFWPGVSGVVGTTDRFWVVGVVAGAVVAVVVVAWASRTSPFWTVVDEEAPAFVVVVEAPAAVVVVAPAAVVVVVADDDSGGSVPRTGRNRSSAVWPTMFSASSRFLTPG